MDTYDTKHAELMRELQRHGGGSYDARWEAATWLMETYHGDIPYQVSDTSSQAATLVVSTSAALPPAGPVL